MDIDGGLWYPEAYNVLFKHFLHSPFQKKCEGESINTSRIELKVLMTTIMYLK